MIVAAGLVQDCLDMLHSRLLLNRQEIFGSVVAGVVVDSYLWNPVVKHNIPEDNPYSNTD